MFFSSLFDLSELGPTLAVPREAEGAFCTVGPSLLDVQRALGTVMVALLDVQRVIRTLDGNLQFEALSILGPKHAPNISIFF